MKEAAAVLTSLNQPQISTLERNGEISIEVNNQPYTILQTEVEIIAEDILAGVWQVKVINSCIRY